jgi:plasmid stabilization system protein ParE
MKYLLSLRREAVVDMAEAEAFYAEEQPDLDQRFRNDVAELLKRIQESPRQFPISEKPPYRMATMATFPFSVYFSVQQNKIVIIAVYHAQRDPAGWKKRAKP